MNCEDHSYRRLYEFIEDLKDVELLAQQAMKKKKDNELVFIFPGWNRDLKKEEKERLIFLEEQYKTDNPQKICYGDNPQKIYYGNDNHLGFIKERLNEIINSL